jgi:hypothetical protein
MIDQVSLVGYRRRFDTDHSTYFAIARHPSARTRPADASLEDEPVSAAAPGDLIEVLLITGFKYGRRWTS